MNKSN